MDIWACISESDPSRILAKADDAIRNNASAVRVRMDVVRGWGLETARRIAAGIPCMSIASLRTAWQGGFFSGGDNERMEKIFILIDAGFSMVEIDLEMDGPCLKKLVGHARQKGVKILFIFNCLSWPIPFEALKGMVKDHYSPGDVFAFVAPINSRSTLDDVFSVSRRLSSEGYVNIPVGSGVHGRSINLLSSSTGVKIIQESASSKDDPSIDVESLNKASNMFPRSFPYVEDFSSTILLGGLMHHTSYSNMPLLYNMALSKHQPRIIYTPLMWSKGNVEDLVDMTIDLEYKGFHVEAGLQKPIIDALDSIDKHAKRIMAVDTVAVKGEELIGVNTRYYGYTGLKEEIPVSLKEKSVFIMGKGGELRTAIDAFKDMGGNVSFSCPGDPEKEKNTIRDIFEDCHMVPWSKRQTRASDSDIIVLAPMIKWKEEVFDRSALGSGKILIDMQTEMMESPGMRKRDRIILFTTLDVFPYQASKALKLWTGENISSEMLFSTLARSDIGR